jgi:transcriptional regulator GlxA family with amidase domain
VFFRLWALDQAHRRLVRARRTDDTVTRIALDVGYGHLGRFSEHYRLVYGELPSETLRAHPAGPPPELITGTAG